MRTLGWIIGGLSIAVGGCGVLSTGSASQPPTTGGIGGPVDSTADSSPTGGPTDRRSEPPTTTPRPAPPSPRADKPAPSGDTPGHSMGHQRLWAWFNPGTSSNDIEGQRGIGLESGYRSLKRGGWGAWIDERLVPLGNPPVVLRAPFGTSRWTDRNGEESIAFRFEDTIDVQRDPEWAWIASDSMFVEPWARYPGPVAFHVGTADDRELDSDELRLGVEPFVRVKARREALGNDAPVYVVLDHSMSFGDTATEDRGKMSRREVLQTSMAVTLLENAGIHVLCEAVPDRTWPSAEYWVTRGVAFRPHLSEDRRWIKPVPLEQFEGLVLAWMLPPDFKDDTETDADRRRRVLEATRKFGNVAVPIYAVGGGDGWRQLRDTVEAEQRRR